MEELYKDERSIKLDPVTREREPGELVVGLDIGTTKICCVVGEVFD